MVPTKRSPQTKSICSECGGSVRYPFYEAAEVIANTLTCASIPLAVRETLGAWRVEQLQDLLDWKFPDERELLEVALESMGFIPSVRSSDASIVQSARFDPEEPSVREQHFTDLVRLMDIFRYLKDDVLIIPSPPSNVTHSLAHTHSQTNSLNFQNFPNVRPGYSGSLNHSQGGCKSDVKGITHSASLHPLLPTGDRPESSTSAAQRSFLQKDQAVASAHQHICSTSTSALVLEPRQKHARNLIDLNECAIGDALDTSESNASYSEDLPGKTLETLSLSLGHGGPITTPWSFHNHPQAGCNTRMLDTDRHERSLPLQVSDTDFGISHFQ
mmetsp:Transcript_2093/g.3944  ORF Transcript_2093/g.3944 Transcript_2093/m.3944 type:complete len:329 (+) Transcript_2093:56-1042(+)